ncbi:MAG: hypothetical protein WD960_13115 [Gemmatimonadota bacterium]
MARGSRSILPGKRRDRTENHLPAILREMAAPSLTAVSSKAIRRWAKRRRPSLPRILRGAAAGAGAAGIVHAYRYFTGDRDELDLIDELLAGAGRGVIYAAVLNPLLPGPPVVRGAVVGTADYLISAWGGVYGLLQDLSPAQHLPLVRTLLETGDAEDDPYIAFLIYGLALAVLQGRDETGD